MTGTAWYAQAQPVQRLVEVVVSPDHADWRYKSGEEVTFSVQVYQFKNLLKNVTIDYELGPEFFPTTEKKGVVLKDGKITLKATMKEPGFLRCRVTAKVGGNDYAGMATAAYDETKIQPATADPPDFDMFWADAIEEARKTPLNAQFTLLSEKCTSTQNVYEVSFQNERPNSRIYAILIVPKKPGKYPAILQVPGAGITRYNGMSYGDNIISLQMGIHGIPVTLPQEVYRDLSGAALRGYTRINKNDKNAYYYKRVYLGCIRAIDFIYSLPEFDGQTVGVAGSSQGGGLSIVTAGLDARIRFLAPRCPALCDYAGYLKGRAGGWPHYFQTDKPAPGEVETLAYFDVVNFARRVKAPGLYYWGFNDTTCPPTSMYAAYNVIQAPKELKIFPDAGHWTYPEQNVLSIEWLRKQCGK
jgi:cephalosporin-C deacetylase-like acetyl esterase